MNPLRLSKRSPYAIKPPSCQVFFLLIPKPDSRGRLGRSVTLPLPTRKRKDSPSPQSSPGMERDHSPHPGPLPRGEGDQGRGVVFRPRPLRPVYSPAAGAQIPSAPCSRGSSRRAESFDPRSRQACLGVECGRRLTPSGAVKASTGFRQGLLHEVEPDRGRGAAPHAGASHGFPRRIRPTRRPQVTASSR